MKHFLKGFSREEIAAVLRYDPRTGLCIRLGGPKVGKPAGALCTGGYVQIRVFGVLILAHQIGWFLTHGSLPDNDLDHRNRVRNDNRLSNLRPATRSENVGNSTLRKDNTSGFRGVSWHKTKESWWANICINKQIKRLGFYEDIRHAAAVYNYEASVHFGEFADLNDIPCVGKLCVEPDSIGLYL